MKQMTRTIARLIGVALMVWGAAAGAADKFEETIAMFKQSGQSAAFFKDSYGYAVFPTIGKGGLVVGGGYGDGRVYRQGKYVGDVSMTQVSFGLQAGGQAYSQIVFFEDQRAFDDFADGTYELGADASAVALTASATASANTAGPTASKGTAKDEATTATRGYRKGLAIFTIAKGGAMAQAAVAGQKFSYSPRDSTGTERLSSDD
jgi:lipid-binding SYLF domain-containing protein